MKTKYNCNAPCTKLMQGPRGLPGEQGDMGDPGNVVGFTTGTSTLSYRTVNSNVSTEGIMAPATTTGTLLNPLIVLNSSIYSPVFSATDPSLISFDATTGAFTFNQAVTVSIEFAVMMLMLPSVDASASGRCDAYINGVAVGTPDNIYVNTPPNLTINSTVKTRITVAIGDVLTFAFSLSVDIEPLPPPPAPPTANALTIMDSFVSIRTVS